ncbi:hypothetical protein Hanom_Chr11g01021781 [Helianthus anomalus]
MHDRCYGKNGLVFLQKQFSLLLCYADLYNCLGSDVPMKLKVVFLLLLPWYLRWTVINLLEKLNFMLYYQWIVASRPHKQGNIEVTRLALMEAHQHFSFRNGILDTRAYDIQFLQVFKVSNHIGQSERKLATQSA